MWYKINYINKGVNPFAYPETAITATAQNDKLKSQVFTNQKINRGWIRCPERALLSHSATN